MAKTTKKRANTKGAAKKASPKKAKPSNKPAAKAKRATARKPISRSGFAPLSVSRCTMDLREPQVTAIAATNVPHDRRTVEERFEAEVKAYAERVNRMAEESKPKRFRFRDAITGLFVKLGFAKANPGTTVRERVK